MNTGDLLIREIWETDYEFGECEFSLSNCCKPHTVRALRNNFWKAPKEIFIFQNSLNIKTMPIHFKITVNVCKYLRF